MDWFNFFRRREMKREIELTIRGLTYSEPTSYNKKGSTTVETNPFMFDREEIRVSWKLEGKRDDLRVGQSISCSLTIHGVEEAASAVAGAA